MRILLVEDDTLLAQILVDHLTAQYYVVDVATDGVTGFDYAQAASYDLIVLDVNLPKLNGIRLCQMLRQHHYTMPILLLTAQGDSSDKVMGLDAGADDYVVKPCTVEEISARIRALLRRRNIDGTPILTWGTLCLNPVTHEVTCNEQLLSLSPKEYSLLELLLRNPRRVFSSGSILEHLWSFEDAPSEETIRSHIKRLRRKLKASSNDEIIETVYGVGYRLKTAPSASPSPPSPATSVEPPDPNVAATDPNAAKDAARTAAVAVWEQFKQPIWERVALLDQAVIALESGHLPEQVRQDAANAAHKLAGSLAMFGFAAGTQLGRDLEQLLHTANQPKPAHLKLKSLVDELHQVLQGSHWSQTSDSANPQPQFPSPGPAHLLIIDSDTTLTQKLQATGRELGIQTSVVCDLTEAQLFLATQTPDILLLDLAFPNPAETELTFLEELSQQCPKIPVIVFTDQDTFSNRLTGIRWGCDHFISKKTSLDQVFAIVQDVLKQRSIVSVKVLAVDDDPLILHQLNQCLSAWGIQLTTLETPETFWQTLEDLQPDLVILDVEMPAINGIELCQVIRSDRTWSKLPILFLTAQREADAILKIFKAGADDYVSKPFTDAEVVTRIFNRITRNRL